MNVHVAVAVGTDGTLFIGGVQPGNFGNFKIATLGLGARTLKAKLPEDRRSANRPAK